MSDTCLIDVTSFDCSVLYPFVSYQSLVDVESLTFKVLRPFPVRSSSRYAEGGGDDDGP